MDGVPDMRQHAGWHGAVTHHRTCRRLAKDGRRLMPGMGAGEISVYPDDWHRRVAGDIYRILSQNDVELNRTIVQELSLMVASYDPHASWRGKLVARRRDD